MAPWQIALGVAAAVFFPFAVYRLHRWLLRLEDRGYIYYWHKRSESGSLSSLAALHEAVEPGHRHVIEIRHDAGVPRRSTADDPPAE